MFRLAAPLVLAEIGWMAMGVEDTMFVGRVSAEAIGAVSIGSMIFYTAAIFGGGLLLGLDTMVSQAFGAGDRDDYHHSLVNGIWLALLLVLAGDGGHLGEHSSAGSIRNRSGGAAGDASDIFARSTGARFRCFSSSDSGVICKP